MATQSCPKCQAANRTGAKFCNNCGYSFSSSFSLAQDHPQLFCDTCGHPTQSTARFCAHCGSPHSASQARMSLSTPSPPRFPIQKRWILWGGLAAALLLVITCFVAAPFVRPQLDSIAATDTIEVRTPGEEDGTVPLSTGEILDGEVDVATSVPESTLGPQPTLTPVIIPGLGIEIPHLTDEEEIEIGRQASAEFEREYPLSTDYILIERVTLIGERIESFQPRSNISYTFKVVDTSEVNAYAIPGGFIYVTRGMMDYIESDDELAGVIGHEIAHVALRHGAQQIEAIAAGQAALEVVVSGDPNLEMIYQDQSVQIATQIMALVAVNGWSRQAELDADEYGTIYMAHADYNPQAIIGLFTRFAAEEGESADDMLAALFATHPPFDDRIARVEQAIHMHGLQ
jgi:hypothetical protein